MAKSERRPDTIQANDGGIKTLPTVSQAKNIMRRAASEIVDPGLNTQQKDELWKHFRSSCAFCGEHIERSSRTGHIDHLESNAGNGPRNRVLACARCNGDEKREREWLEFLGEKCETSNVLNQRRSLIEAWASMHPQRDLRRSQEMEDSLEELESVVKQFHDVCERLRRAVKATSV